MYDLTLVYWDGAGNEPYPVGYPRKEKFLPLLKHLGLEVQLVLTSEYFRLSSPWERIKGIVDSDKILITLNDPCISRDIRPLLSLSGEKELYFIIQQEEGSLLTPPIRKLVGEFATKIFVSMEMYRKEWMKDVPSSKLRVLRFPATEGRDLDKEECREEVGVETRYALICWGYRRFVKGYHIVLDWLRDWEDVTILYAGSVEREHLLYEKILRKLSRKYEGRVLFSPSPLLDEDADVWFGAADLKVYPHITFALGSLHYAIGHGKCCVTPRMKGYEEMATYSGVVPTENMKLTTRLLLETPEVREREEEKSREYTKRHNWYQFTKKLVEELYLETKETPEIAVCIPTKNAAEHITRHLQSWERIYYPKKSLRFYFIDGYSRDGTREKIKDFCERNMLSYRIELDPEYENPIGASGWIADTMNQFHRLLGDEKWVVIADSDIVSFSPFLLVQLLDAGKEVVAPYVYTHPSTRKFYDCTLFRIQGMNFGKDAPWKERREPIEMESVGTMVLVKREIFDRFRFSNPLPTYQFLQEVRKAGIKVWAYPPARVFHKVLRRGHPSIEQYVSWGLLPQEVLERIPKFKDFITRSGRKEKELRRRWEEKERCHFCGSKRLGVREGFIFCLDCKANLGKKE